MPYRQPVQPSPIRALLEENILVLAVRIHVCENLVAWDRGGRILGPDGETGVEVAAREVRSVPVKSVVDEPGSDAAAALTEGPPSPYAAPSSQTMIAFCTWRRFSAWSKTTDRGPSRTASVISSPRWAGRQCMTSASGLASATTRSFTW